VNRTSKPILALATFVSLGTLGFNFAFVGAALPEMLGQFGIRISQASLIPATVQVAYALLCFLGGIVADFVNKRRILIVGCVVIGLGAGVVGLPSGFWANLLLFGVIGIGAGTVFISSNLLVIELFPENPGSYLNIHHLTFALCSFIAPIIMSRAITSGAGWQTAFRGLAVLSAILALALLLNRFPMPKPTPPSGVNPWKSRIDALKSRNSAFVIFLTFLAIGTQFTIMFLLVTYLVDAKGFSVPGASAALAGFYILLAGGRLVCSVLVRRYSNRLILLVLLGLLAAFIVVGILGEPAIAGVALALTGLAASGLYPSILAMASEVTHATSRGIVLGSLAMAGGFGGMAVTQVTAGVSERIGILSAFWVVLGVVAFTFLYLLVLGRGIRPVER
jgi:fucose permease